MFAYADMDSVQNETKKEKDSFFLNSTHNPAFNCNSRFVSIDAKRQHRQLSTLVQAPPFSLRLVAHTVSDVTPHQLRCPI